MHNKLTNIEEVREFYLKPYLDNNIKVPKETWHLIMKEVDKILEKGIS